MVGICYGRDYAYVMVGIKHWWGYVMVGIGYGRDMLW